MQGPYIATVLPEKTRNMQHLQGNFLQLMAAVTRDEINFDEVEELVSRDVTLTYAPVSYTHLDVYKRQSLEWIPTR